MVSGSKKKPGIAVVLGRVSTEDTDRVIETIEALDPAVSGETCEIVIADRLQDEITGRIRRDYPQVSLIDCPPGMTLCGTSCVALQSDKRTFELQFPSWTEKIRTDSEWVHDLRLFTD